MPGAEFGPAGPRLNRAPLVLVGGMMVWGRDEVFGYKYWGGLGWDLQEDLGAWGFEAVTAAPGPFSSNWDRAAEVYAQVQGGRVDYGKAHAERHGHARFGRAFPGLLPAWGAPALPKVHLVGHSMGGQTLRVLAHLLAEGDEEERRATAPDDLSPLFRGGHDRVASLTTLSTPHDGSTLTRKREGIRDLSRQLLALFQGLGRGRGLYDLKLDAWGLGRTPREPWAAYRARLLENPFWLGTEDFCAGDLSLEGARALNAWVKLPAGVPGFSLSTSSTKAAGDGIHQPIPGMTFLWKPGARYMGGPQPLVPGQLPVDATWYENDGVVNTRSMAGPATEAVVPFAGEPRPGVWNHLGVLAGWDHTEVLGMGPGRRREAPGLYRSLAELLGSLRP